ncbi:MAG: caspase family protein [Myxococcota bacterium]
MIRALLTLALLLGAAAWGAPVRLAIIYGHNGGGAGRAALKYAEADAGRVARTLQEVGGVAAGDMQLLLGRPVAELEAALAWAKSRAASNPQTSLVLYISSHADATEGLLPGSDALPWTKLKALVAATGAKARVTIVDGCQSSGLIEASAREAPTFTIAATDELTVKGDAFITSSASDEPSLEAGQLKGSVFTQHFLAGLRGAADRSGDGRVSLEEVYRYAFERTTEGQSGQHPGFATRLSGYGELVMASPGVASGLLVPEGVERIVVREPTDRSPLVSARRPEARRLAVPPGAWLVEVEQAAGAREGKVQVAKGAFTSVEVDQLGAVARAATLIRLEDEAPCYEVRAGRPDPRVQALLPELSRVAPACPEGRAPAATLVLESGPKGALRVRAAPDLDVSRPAQESGALVDSVRAWVAERGANPASTKRKP